MATNKSGRDIPEAYAVIRHRAIGERIGRGIHPLDESTARRMRAQNLAYSYGNASIRRHDVLDFVMYRAANNSFAGSDQLDYLLEAAQQATDAQTPGMLFTGRLTADQCLQLIAIPKHAPNEALTDTVQAWAMPVGMRVYGHEGYLEYASDTPSDLAFAVNGVVRAIDFRRQQVDIIEAQLAA